jgi:hypothetical protein
MKDPETNEAGRRRDGKYLIGQWVTDHPNLNVSESDFLLG